MQDIASINLPVFQNDSKYTAENHLQQTLPQKKIR